MTTTHIFLSMFATMMIPAVINRITGTVVKRSGRTVAIMIVIIGAMFLAVTDALTTNPLFETLKLDQFHMVVVALAGTYLATIESNHAIALMLKGANLMPSSPTPGDGPENGAIDEPARGRFIGYLERMIVFLLVLSGEVNAIGFVLVAKGIARFQQLDDRAFAEYFLIGTLMSIAMAAIVGIVFGVFL